MTRTATRFVDPRTLREVRLGRLQRQRLEDCAREPQRCGPGNPTFRALHWHLFVSQAPHISPRTRRPTTDRMWTITDVGRLYLKIGRDRK